MNRSAVILLTTWSIYEWPELSHELIGANTSSISVDTWADSRLFMTKPDLVHESNRFEKPNEIPGIKHESIEADTWSIGVGTCAGQGILLSRPGSVHESIRVETFNGMRVNWVAGVEALINRCHYIINQRWYMSRSSSISESNRFVKWIDRERYVQRYDEYIKGQGWTMRRSVPAHHRAAAIHEKIWFGFLVDQVRYMNRSGSIRLTTWSKHEWPGLIQELIGAATWSISVDTWADKGRFTNQPGSVHVSTSFEKFNNLIDTWVVSVDAWVNWCRYLIDQRWHMSKPGSIYEPIRFGAWIDLGRYVWRHDSNMSGYGWYRSRSLPLHDRSASIHEWSGLMHGSIGADSWSISNDTCADQGRFMSRPDQVLERSASLRLTTRSKLEQPWLICALIGGGTWSISVDTWTDQCMFMSRPISVHESIRVDKFNDMIDTWVARVHYEAKLCTG